MSATPTGTHTPVPPDDDRKVGEMVFDVTERVSLLVREEIELAKVELTEKVSNLVRGSVVGIVAGVFVLLGLAMLMHAIAWLINDLLGIEGSVWIGFGIEALLWFIVAAIAGLVAYRAVKKGAPPVPEMAIEEAKETKATLGRKP
jgi:uncharacterized membrane protein YqjE